MKATIKNIVSEAVSQAKMEASISDRTMILSDVKLEINCIVEFIKFDSEIAKSMFLGFIENELRNVAPFLFPAKMQMDANGDYTSDSNLWA